MSKRLVLLAAVALIVGGAWSSSRSLSKPPPPCRDAALVSLRTGKVLRRFTAAWSDFARGYAGPVIPGAAAAPDGRGGWFVAGVGIRRMRGDGTLEKAWRSRVGQRRPVSGLVRIGGTLYGHDGYRVYAVSARSGRILWTSQRVHLGTRVGILALAATRSAVYIGGYFTHVGRPRRSALAALDPRTGHLLRWRAPPLGYSPSFPTVSVLALSRTRLYFGGGFLRVGRAARRGGVAAVRLRDGALTPFRPRSRIGAVVGLAVARGLVLIGGPEGGGVFDARTSDRRPDMEPLPSASAITVRGHFAYLGGNVRDMIGAGNLLAIDLRSGKLRPWFPNVARYVSVGQIAISGDRAFVGGSFCSTLGG